MSEPIPVNNGNTMKKPNKKTFIFIIAGILILAAAASLLLPRLMKKKTDTEATTALVTRGSIIKTVEGSGTIAAIDQYTISSLVTGEVMADYFEEGDIVNEDDLLYVIDSTDQDFSIQKAENGVKSAEMTYSESQKNLSYQTVTAPFSGTITELYIKEGDTVSAGGKIADITDDSVMILKLDFLASDAADIYPGQAATVVATASPSETLFGTVKSVASGQNVNSMGASVTSVEISVDNPGGIVNGSSGTATVGIYACNAPGTFESRNSRTVTAKTGGDVTSLPFRRGDAVKSGDVLVRLSSDSTENNAKKAGISLSDARSSLENAYDKLKDYRITAPITGKVIQKTVKAGDKLENGANGNTSSMAIIADLSTLTFEMSVDELDISSIKEGQTVTVTADALEGETFTGYVDNVSIVGTAQNGVTTYPVKVVLDGEENDRLIPGMNVDATIIVESRENVLVIPASAIDRGNMVAVKDGGSTQGTTENRPDGMPGAPENGNKSEKNDDKAAKTQKDAPSGYHYVRIETGITDGNLIEVTNGLKEGDTVLLPDTKKDGAVELTRDSQMPGMMGNMSAAHGNMGGGGMTGGGMSGGGMSGGGMR